MQVQWEIKLDLVIELMQETKLDYVIKVTLEIELDSVSAMEDKYRSHN